MALVGILLYGVLTFLLILFLYAAYAFRKRAEYFKKHDIPYLGSGLYRTFQLFSGSTNLALMELDIYKEAKESNTPMVGISDIFGSKSMYITDLELVRNIFVKDFDHFLNGRPIDTKNANQYFKRMLFLMEGEQWKGIRAKLSPSFTTGKIKRMFEIFKRSSERMDEYLKAQIQPNCESLDLDFDQLFPKYAMDVIASCCFGIDSKSMDVPPDQMSQFEKMGKQFQIKLSLMTLIKFIMVTVAPKLMDFLGISSTDQEAELYFVNVVKDVMKRRRKASERRDDFLQLMIDAQDGILKIDDESNQVMFGRNEGDSGEQGKLKADDFHGKVKFDDDDIVANGLMFFLGGFDPTQSVLLFTVYNLAVNSDVQEKLFEEVKKVTEKNGGKLSYENVAEMKYLDLIINETMRLYSPSSRTERSCTKDYVVPGTNLKIEKGSLIVIPIHALHHDEKYFPDPEKFIPERFTSENKANRHPYAFMPFGHGPRNCIGLRFALIKAKAALAQLVISYKLEPCSKTKIPVEFGINANLKPKNGMWLKVTPRN